jgi:hypothetical protein
MKEISMQMVRGTIAFALIAVLGLSACGNRNKTPLLMNVHSNTSGPDEFTILPGKPLESPGNYAELPQPTPGGSNLTDPTPEADAVAALGGRAGMLQRDGKAGPDGAIMSHAGRYGISAGIRESLAAEDVEYRRRHDGRLLERLFNVNVYYKAYAPMSLNQYRELVRFRRAGVRTPSVPPPGIAPK